MALYDDLAAAAIEMLADPEISQQITLVRPGSDEVYDDDTGSVVEGPPESFVGSGVVFDYEEKLVDGTNILAGDQRVLLAPDLEAVPQSGDTLVLASGKLLQVVVSRPLAPAGQTVLHDVQARDL